MKKIVVLTVLAIAALTACTASDTPTPTVTITERAPQPEAPSLNNDDGVVSTEQEYVIAVRSIGNYIISAASDAELIEMGQIVCEVLASGYTIDEVIYLLAEEMVNSGNTSEDYVDAVSSILAASTLVLCPQYSV